MMTLSMCFHPNRAAALSVVGGNVRGAVIQIMDKDERYTEIDLGRAAEGVLGGMSG